MELNNLYQELIIDHGMHPRHFHKLDKATCIKEGFNPLCGDSITLYLQIEDDVIKNVSFEGRGCAISTASASLMAEMLQDKTVEEAENLFSHFQSVMTTETSFSESLGKLVVFNGVKAFPARVKCATLAWHTLHAALKQDPAIVTTE